MEFEDILKQVGEYGRYQKKLLYFFLIPTCIIFAFLCMNTFFMLSEPDHRCKIDEISNLPESVQNFFSRPPLATFNPLSDHQDDSSSSSSEVRQDSCRFYDMNYANLSQLYLRSLYESNDTSIDNLRISFPDIHENSSTKFCHEWIFDKENWDATAVTELKLVCDQSHWKSLILTAHGIGEVVGNPFFGALSDKFGRHITFFLALIAGVSSSSSPILFKGILVFAIFRFINSFTSASLFNLPYIILTEIVGPEYRTRLIGIGATCWTIGMCILPLIAYFARDWVILTIIPTLCIIPFFAYWNFLPESPRWLIAQGKYDRAYEIMARIAKENGNAVPPDLMDQLKAVNQKSKESSESDGSFLDIVTKPGLRKKFLILTLSWTANVTAYRGLTLNFENFHGNEFVNWLLLSLVEFPSNFTSWYLMETRLGRRWTNSLSMSLGGISLCLPIILPNSWPHATIIASLSGKFLCNVAYNAVYQQTAELFPTPVRNQGMSYTTAIAAGANFALPYLASLGRVHVWIPLIVMGLICVMAGIGAAFLPETLYENLPQTIEDGDNFGRGMKFFRLAKSREENQEIQEKRRASSLLGSSATYNNTKSETDHSNGVHLISSP